MKKATSYLSLVLVSLIIVFICSSCATSTPEIKIHYLGHSAFVLEFDNDVTVVTDYGNENAWAEWGWDDPIASLNDLVPDVMTFSHTHHKDHYDPARIPEGVKHILTGTDTLSIDGLSITPIRVCEADVNNEDNSAFLFEYKGLTILHLGDAQAQIQNINDSTVAAHIREIIPGDLDLLFMTIDGPKPLGAAAETFVDAVHPRRVIPMHYWTDECLSKFISNCRSKKSEGKSYSFEEPGGPVYSLFSSDEVDPVRVLILEPAEYSLETEIEN
ncbi:MBL fold metallo-hydrolase [Bacteroidota bacterium]